MERLTTLVTDWKIPVGRTARVVFDWLRDHAAPVFDAISAFMDALIAGILWVLSTPNPFVIIAVAAGLTWLLQRRAGTTLLVAAGLLFILNQGYWTETMQSLTLVLSACVVCMAVGVPI